VSSEASCCRHATTCDVPVVHRECVRKLLPGGKVGLFLVDMRGSLSFMYDAKGRSYFGERQWADMENAYGADGLFKDCTTVLAVHSSPAVFFGSCCAR